MHYVYYFDIAAIILSCTILLAFGLRKSYLTRASRLFVTTVALNLFSATADLIAAFTLSAINHLPLWCNYLSNGIYLFLHLMTAVAFCLYVIAITKAKSIRVGENVMFGCIAGVSAALMLSTPLTGWVFYFDSMGNYAHGPLFALIIVAGSVALFYSAFILIYRRSALTRYQMVVLLASIVFAIAALLFQSVFPSLLVETFSISILSMLAYATLESPADYMYGNSYCFNNLAFRSEVEKALRGRQRQYVVAFGFSNVSYLRHVMGMERMRMVIDRIAALLHESFGQECVFYLNAYRFAIMVKGGNDAVEEAFDKLKAMFSSPLEIDGIRVHLSVCLCSMELPGFAETPLDAEAAICEGLYVQESASIEGPEVVKGTALEQRRREAHIVEAMKNALRHDGFTVVYQPILDLKTRRFTSMEALVRLEDEKLGFINPEEFISLAEENGMILEVGDVVFEKVCAFWSKHDFPSMGIQFVEVNLSMVQCMHKHMAAHCLSVLERFEVNPSHINFEITETAELTNWSVVIANMEALGKEGLRFSLDDYGTGYATTGSLFQLPIEYVKIDKSILWQAMENEQGMALLRNCVSMVKDMGKRSVVEGVETEEMERFLGDLGCDYLQGYLYSKPIPGDKLIEFLSEHGQAVK